MPEDAATTRSPARRILISRILVYPLLVLSVYGTFLLATDEEFDFAFGVFGWAALAAGFAAGARLFRSIGDPRPQPWGARAGGSRLGPLGRSVVRDLLVGIIVLVVGQFIVITIAYVAFHSEVDAVFAMPAILVPLAVGSAFLGWLAFFAVGIPVGSIVADVIARRGFYPVYLVISVVCLAFLGYPLGVALGCEIPGSTRSAVARATFTALTGIERGGVQIINEGWIWVARVSFAIGVAVVVLVIIGGISIRRDRRRAAA